MRYAMREIDAPIRRPQVAQEAGDPLGWLAEDLLWHTLLIRAQAKHAKLIEPGRNGITLVMGQALAGRQIDLIPLALRRDARCHRVAKDIPCQLRHRFGQQWFACSVLDNMARECAAIADQVAQQRQFFVAHRRLGWPWQCAGKREAHTWGQFVESAPAPDGEELVVGRRADAAPKPCRQPIDQPASGGKRTAYHSRLHLPCLCVQRQHVETRLPHQLLDWPINTLIRQIDQRLARQAARLTKVAELWLLFSATFYCA